MDDILIVNKFLLLQIKTWYLIFVEQLKLSKKSKSKPEDKTAVASGSAAAPLDSGILQEELQKKIIENAQYASQVNSESKNLNKKYFVVDDHFLHLGVIKRVS